jgi:hypothetical protein
MQLALYALGLLAGSLAGFLSPAWYLGFIPLSAGLLWAAYDLEEVADGEVPPSQQRSFRQ